MRLWLLRAGKNGEFENKFLTDKRVYLTWDNLDIDLFKREPIMGLIYWHRMELWDLALLKFVFKLKQRILQWIGQLWTRYF